MPGSFEPNLIHMYIYIYIYMIEREREHMPVTAAID